MKRHPRGPKLSAFCEVTELDKTTDLEDQEEKASFTNSHRRLVKMQKVDYP